MTMHISKWIHELPRWNSEPNPAHPTLFNPAWLNPDLYLIIEPSMGVLTVLLYLGYLGPACVKNRLHCI